MSELKRPIGIIVLGHGSRRLEANKEVETIAQMLAQRQKNCLVQAAFAEFAEPNLEKAANILVQQQVKEIIIVPLFLTVKHGFHHFRHTLSYYFFSKNNYTSVISLMRFSKSCTITQRQMSLLKKNF